MGEEVPLWEAQLSLHLLQALKEMLDQWLCRGHRRVVVAFSSSLLTAPRPTARMTAGEPTRRGTGQPYLSVGPRLSPNSRNTLLPLFPCFNVETNHFLRTDLKKEM